MMSSKSQFSVSHNNFPGSFIKRKTNRQAKKEVSVIIDDRGSDLDSSIDVEPDTKTGSQT